MNVRKEDFPVVLQAYDLVDTKEIFLAEQVVNNQADVDNFSARYTGKLIKAKQHTIPGTNTTTTTGTSTTRNQVVTPVKRRSSPAVAIIVAIVILLIILAVIGYYTGWIQQHMNIGE